MQKRLILLIETATTSCSIALCENETILAVKELNERNVHASYITLFIEEVMQKAGKVYTDLDAIAVSKGPGSYTGLRIGVSTAKGLCYALDIPLIGIDTLQAMAFGALQKSLTVNSQTLLVPMIDARRMEVYMGIFQTDLSIVESVSARIIDDSSFEVHKDKDLIFFGDGSDKFRELFSNHSHIRFLDFENSATHLCHSANQMLIEGQIENLAYFEPYYLKDFIPGKAAV